MPDTDARTLLAAHALAGLLANPSYTFEGPESRQDIADEAVALADAVAARLACRAKDGQPPCRFCDNGSKHLSDLPGRNHGQPLCPCCERMLGDYA